MEQVVRVLKCEPDGSAQVLHIRQSACSGDCHKCSGCGAVQEKLLLTARNPIGAQPGDVVIIRSKTGPVLAAAAMLYMLPLVLFFAGYALGYSLGLSGGLVGGLGFVLGLVFAVWFDRYTAKKGETVYTITGYAPGQGHA